MAKNNVRKKYRVRKGRVALAAVVVSVILAGIITAVVALVHNIRDRRNTSETVAPAPSHTLPDGEYIRIDMDDCNMYVGNILRLRCVSQPQDYADKVIWKSSDEEVVSVNKTGDIIVKSVGTAAITATYGTLSDSVIIKAISRDTTEADSNLPVYDVDDDGQIIVAETAAGYDGSGSVRETAGPGENSTVVSTGGNKEGETAVEPPHDDMTQPASSEDSEKPSSGPGPLETTEDSGNQEMSYPEIISQAASEAGFRLYVGNTYIFVEDGNYLGEAIVGADYVQIYVMTRTSSFDRAVKNVIMSVVPDSYETVFNGFVSTDRDQTISADGHMVRYIAPSGGGHAQLIIYY